MGYVANRFTVILDANVMYPMRKRDILLSFHEAGMFRARWTSEILEEWTGNLKLKRPDMVDKVDEVRSTIETVFDDSLVNGHLSLIDGLNLPDENDRHVLAAAIQCNAQIIVTDNLKDFPSCELSKFDIEALSADQFLTETFGLFKFEAVKTIKAIRKKYVKHPMTPSEFLMDLNAKGLPSFAAELRNLKDFI